MVRMSIITDSYRTDYCRHCWANVTSKRYRIESILTCNVLKGQTNTRYMMLLQLFIILFMMLIRLYAKYLHKQMRFELIDDTYVVVLHLLGVLISKVLYLT